MKTVNTKTEKLQVDKVEIIGRDVWKKVEPEQDPAWQPQNPGDEFVGKYLSFRSDVGDNHSMLYRLEDLDGNAWVVWGNTVLDRRMQSVAVGSEIKIVYLGKKQSEKTSRMYHDYDVYCK